MRRSVAEALQRRPLFFEPVPSPARSSPERRARDLDAIAQLVASVDRIDTLDVPDLVDENHEGRPYYRSVESRQFARTLQQRTGREVVVNKVVAHLASAAALRSWAEATVGSGLRHLVLIGGSSRFIPYPGPAVAEADRIVREMVTPAGGLIGNVAIPQRQGEAHRMLQKTRAGASFFTTQIVFGAESVLSILRDYDRLCRQAGISPSAVLVSVAPIADETDAEFVRWLGADIPESAERAILNGDEAGASGRSVGHALRVWTDLLQGMSRSSIDLPVGVNIEQVSARHLSSAGEMLRAFSGAIDFEVSAEVARA